MPLLYSAELAGLGQSPINPPRAPVYGGKVRVYQATITMASQVAGTDWFLLARLPRGTKILYGVIATTTSLGSAVLAIGTNSTHGSNGQYRAAAAFTATDTPTLFGVVATTAANAVLADDTDVFATWASANLPASGTLTIQLYVAVPN